MSGLIDLIHQDRVWVDKNKTVHLIDKMDIRHAQNIFRYLTEGSKPRMVADWMLGALMSGPHPNGEMAQDAFDSETERLMILRDDEDLAREWLLGQPLLKALAARARERYGSPQGTEPQHRTLTFVVQVKVVHGAYDAPVEHDIEEALNGLGYEIEILGPRG